MIDFIPDVKSSEEKNVIFLQLFLQIIFYRGSECSSFERAESKGQEASWQEPKYGKQWSGNGSSCFRRSYASSTDNCIQSWTGILWNPAGSFRRFPGRQQAQVLLVYFLHRIASLFLSAIFCQAALLSPGWHFPGKPDHHKNASTPGCSNPGAV